MSKDDFEKSSGMDRYSLDSDLEVPIDIDDRAILASLINATKELKAENESLKARIEALEANS